MAHVAIEQRQRNIQPMLYLGMALTLIATVIPFIDRATTTILADHIRSGYPAYTSSEVDTAVTAWLAILSTVGVLGIAGWVVTARTVRAGKGWAPWLATGMLVIAIGVAISGLTIQDTSGEVGLAPLLGWALVLPCLPGIVAVKMLWRDAIHG